MENKTKRIINTYGVLPQLKYFQSEVFELSEAIIVAENNKINNYKFDISKEDKEHITEELADNLVMLKQFQLHYDIKDEDLKKIMKFKIERQNERIDNNK